MASLKDQWGFFTAMPETVIELTPEIGSDAVFLYLFLRYRTNKKRGAAWPSYDDMRETTRWGKQRISNALTMLEASGLLIKKKRYGQSTIYILPKPPDMGEEEETTPSSTGAVQLEENVSSTGARPQSYRSATPVVPERDYVLKTDLTKTDNNQTENDSRSHERKNVSRQVVEHFVLQSQIEEPLPVDEKGRKEAYRLWREPIIEICELVEWRHDDACALINAAISRMDGDKLTLSSPKSIIKICRSIIAEVKRGTFKPTYNFDDVMAQFLAEAKEMKNG